MAMFAFRPKTIFCILAISGFIAFRCAAQSASLEERLQKLEGEVSALRKENQNLRSDLGLDPKTGESRIKPYGHEAALNVGGVIQVQGEFGDKGDARFSSGKDRVYLRRARMNLMGKFNEYFDFRIEGEFAGPVSESAGNRALLTDAYINWNRWDFANLRIGQFKTPFGYEQLAPDPRLLSIERSLVNDRLTLGRQIGLQVAGDLLNKRVFYATGLFNGSGVNTTANDNDQFLWAGRLSAAAFQNNSSGQDIRITGGLNGFISRDTNLPGQPSEFGLDFSPGGAQDNIFAGHREGGGIDAQVHAGRFDLWVEYLRERFEPTDHLPFAKFAAEGWYAQAGYFVLPKTIEAVLKYDSYDPDVRLGGNSTRTWMVGLNYLIKGDDLKLQVNYLLTDIEGIIPENKKLIVRLQTLF